MNCVKSYFREWKGGFCKVLENDLKTVCGSVDVTIQIQAGELYEELFQK